MTNTMHPDIRTLLHQGGVIPAHPLALTADRRLDERRQRALTRYYLDAGSIGVAVGVHTTQFAIREPQIGLFKPVLELAAATADATARANNRPVLKIAGVCGRTEQAVKEAAFAVEKGYHLGLLSLAAMKTASVDELINHARTVAGVIPVFGFYLQPSVGGRLLPYEFWRRFAEIDNVAAIKIAPFNRYQTFDVIRGVAESGRAGDIAIYTGNDDNIALDLVTPYPIRCGSRTETVRITGGLLGHWSVWTRRAVELCEEARRLRESGCAIPESYLRKAIEITDSNASFFDTANSFAGCIAGLHEVLVRQGLLSDRWCLDPKEDLSPGQMEEIDRVYAAYPHLNDDEFVIKNRDRWLSE